MTIVRFLIALLLSFVITFIVLLAYAFFPLIAMSLSEADHGPGTGGISIAVGGVRSATLWATELIVFAIVFVLMYRRPRKQ